MSNSVKVPTANVIISFDYAIMARFAQHGSLAKLKEDAANSANNGIGIFDNTTNSTLISLDHKYNTEQDGALLTLEFVDPEYSFEESAFAKPIDINAMAILNSPIEDKIRKSEARLAQLSPWKKDPLTHPVSLYRKIAGSVTIAKAQRDALWKTASLHGVMPWSKGMPVLAYDVPDSPSPSYTQPFNFGPVTEAQKAANLRVRKQELLRDFLTDERNRLTKDIGSITQDTIPVEEGGKEWSTKLSPARVAAANKRMLEEVAQAYLSESMAKKPVYVAYGIGNDMRRDWCSPQCFGRVVKIEYSFDGTGARTLKLIFSGKSTIGGVLTKLGTTTLGEAGADIVTIGKSHRLFDGDTAAYLADELTIREASLGISDDLLDQPQNSQHSNSVMLALFPTLAPSKVNRSWTPSFHMAFNQCMTNYIRAAIPPMYKDNVVVLVPDLDRFLSTAWVSLYESCIGQGVAGRNPDYPLGIDFHNVPRKDDPKHSIPATPPVSLGGDEYAMQWFNAFGMLAEKVGLVIAVAANSPGADVPYSTLHNKSGAIIPVPDNYQPPIGDVVDPQQSAKISPIGKLDQHVYTPQDSSFQVIGKLVRDRLTVIQNNKSLASFWEEKKAFLLCQNTYLTTFADKVRNVGRALSSLFAESTVEGAPPIHPRLYIETDMVVLGAMEEAGLIGDATVPAVVWADTYMKSEFLDARLLEKGEVNATRSRKDLMHYSDILNIPVSYYKTIFDYYQPTPLPGSFGYLSRSKADMDSLLDRDPNVQKIFSSYSSANPIMANRIPIFTLGVKSPNVLKVDLDVNNVYTNFIQVGRGRTQITNILNSKYILGETSKNGQQYGLNSKNLAEFFKRFSIMAEEKAQRDADLATPGKDPFWVPPKFKELIEPLYKQFFKRSPPTSTHSSHPGYGEPVKIGPLGNAFSKLEDSNQEYINKELDEIYTTMSKDMLYAPSRLEDDEKKKYDEKVMKFYKLMWAAYSDLYSEAGETYLDQSASYVQYSGKNSVTQSVRQTATLAEKMMRMQLVGKIDTLPMFSLSNTRLAMDRSCLLYSREPRFSNVGVDATMPSIDNSSWFSGIYRLYGWHHKVSQSEATSGFLLSRDTRYNK
tara:strand:+ start:3108 stop:6410 length:3303 start_codon:yes stop_codon:yes gene_type:complete